MVSCTRILNLSVSSAAPFMPSIWRAALSLLAAAFALAACSSLTAAGAARRAAVLSVSGGREKEVCL